MKKLFFLAMCGIVAGVVSCKDPDVIPPPIPKPPVEDVFNDLGFEPHEEGTPFDTYKGLVMAGYQGWFGAPGDGSLFAATENEAWYHYRENGSFGPGVLRNSIDFWPDMREYEKQYTPGESYPNGGQGKTFLYPNGEKATVYSSYDKSSVMLHFKWMQEYGIDGVFMQRFVGEVVNRKSGKEHFNKVLEHAMEASNTYQRAICVMYDLGGYEPQKNNNTAAVLADTKEILDTYQLLDRSKQKYYLHHNDKPLIVLWGVGFNDNRPYSLDDIQQLMDGLKEMGFSIMLGVPTYWRERKNDALSDIKLHNLIKAADVIMPWFVGRFGNDNYVSGGFADLVRADVLWCESNGVDYAPLCYPGSSDRNMHPNNGVNPRYGGKFMWNQMHNCIKSGAKMLYIAMFDEIDEGTAIYKCLNQKDVPANQWATDYYVVYRSGGYSVRALSQGPLTGLTGNDWCRLASSLNITFTGIEDDLQTDHYLWLTGQARKMLRGDIPMTSTQPAR